MKLHWPTAIVLIVALLLLWTAYLFGPALGVPEATHAELVAGIGTAFAFALAWMRSLRDTDHDGIPDIIDGDPK